MTDITLMQMAENARQYAYAPYSHFCVGAALLSQDGRVFCGSNVENRSFGATNCAERSAFFAAVSAGVRDFAAIAISGGPADAPGTHCAPCGICRQVMAEFCAPDFRILLGDAAHITAYPLSALLPHAFEGEVDHENV